MQALHNDRAQQRSQTCVLLLRARPLPRVLLLAARTSLNAISHVQGLASSNFVGAAKNLCARKRLKGKQAECKDVVSGCHNDGPVAGFFVWVIHSVDDFWRRIRWCATRPLAFPCAIGGLDCC